MFRQATEPGPELEAGPRHLGRLTSDLLTLENLRLEEFADASQEPQPPAVVHHDEGRRKVDGVGLLRS